jgi:hypothetical protein
VRDGSVRHWDPENRPFIFQRDDDREVVALSTLSDGAPPGLQAKVLAVNLGVPNRTATPQPVVFIDASIDELLVNESAVPRSVR